MTEAVPITRTRPALVVTAWWLVVAACGFIGFGAAVATLSDPWPALSQQASLLAGVVYLGLAVAGWRWARLATWLRGAMTVLLLLVCGTYLTIMNGDLDTTSSLFEHLVTPVLVLADWVFVARDRALRWWYPVTWLAFPFAYLVYFLAADVRLYRGVLDPDDGGFPVTLAGFLVAVLTAGFLLYGVAKARHVSELASEPMSQGACEGES